MTTITNYINAAYPLLAISTSEPDRAEKTIASELQKDAHTCYRWDLSAGLSEMASGDIVSIDPGPLPPIAWLMSNAAPESTVMFVHNFHKFLGSIEVLQALINSRDVLKSFAKAIVMVGPEITLPIELEKSVQLLDFELPDKDALAGILQSICSDASVQYPENAPDLIKQATGLTSFECENSLALSLSSTGLKGFDREVIIEAKSQIVKKNSSLELGHYKETFSDIGGLQNLKTFCLQTIKSPLSKGVLLLGSPGTGKSLFSKALGREAGLPVLSLDFGRLFGSLVGSSEQKTRECLAVVSAMAPVILFCDELERGMAGMNGSSGDNGVGSRVLGTFLSWLNDRPPQIYVIGTANNISTLPPELLRAERWDSLFYVDLPVEEERNTILEMYKKEFNVEGEAPDTTGFSGAELKSLARIAAMMNISLIEANKYVIPLSKSMGEDIKKQREWAKGRCIPASSIPEKKKSKKTRSIPTPKRSGGGQVISSN